ncbi:MAG: sulfotransferase domain-containing protein [Alphaproteobacteria bacterium]|nr:sulfotransferase domain-containing protein [Alphaproteobacteria bacterium]
MAGGILWLASYPKSGNTWVRIFLDNLFRNAREPVSINDLQVVNFGDAQPRLYQPLSDRPVTDLSDEEIQRLREPVQRHLASRAETSIVKTHNILGHAFDTPIIHLEHSMGAIYIVRNVFDVTVSLARHYGTSMDDAVEGIGRPTMHTPTTSAAVVQHLGRWCDHYRSWMSVPGFEPLVLRYEDLRAKPFKQFSKIAKFLKLPANPDRVKRAIRFSNFDEVSRQEQRHGFTERVREDQTFFRTGKVGGWRQHLTEAQVARLIDVHGEVLRELGYLDKVDRPTV